MMQVKKIKSVDTKKSEILYSEIVHNTKQLKASFLKERDLTGIETLCVKNLDIAHILDYFTKAWDHKTGTFNIQTVISFMNNDDDKKRTVRIKIKGFNQ